MAALARLEFGALREAGRYQTTGDVSIIFGNHFVIPLFSLDPSTPWPLEPFFYLISWFISNMGRHMDSTMKPTMQPITKIITGSK